MTASKSSSSAASAKTRIIAMLKADHKKVKTAFKDFEKIDPIEEEDAAQALVSKTLSDLEIHATLEEQVFYPAARGAVKEEDLIDEAEVEHMTVKVLIQQLKSMQPDNEKFAATFKVLGEYVDHHVKEEEGEIFKQLAATGADWSDVLERMQMQRAQLREQMGLPPEDEEAAPAGSTRASSATRASPGMRSQPESRPQAAESGSGSRSSKSTRSKSKDE